MYRKAGWLAAIVLGIAALAGMIVDGASAQTPAPAPPKATATATATPAGPKATEAATKAPAPAKTGNAGLAATTTSRPAQEAPVLPVTLTLGALIAALVALAKMAYPGVMPSRLSLVVVGVVAAGVLVLAGGARLDLATLTHWVELVFSAMGMRAGLVTAAPGASRLWTRGGAKP
jgi:hypothetical protein